MHTLVVYFDLVLLWHMAYILASSIAVCTY